MKKATKIKLAVMSMMVMLGTVNAQAGYYDYYGNYHPTCHTVQYKVYNAWGCYWANRTNCY